MDWRSIYNAEINIKAIYKLKASLSDLYGSSAADVTSTTTSTNPYKL